MRGFEGWRRISPRRRNRFSGRIFYVLCLAKGKNLILKKESPVLLILRFDWWREVGLTGRSFTVFFSSLNHRKWCVDKEVGKTPIAQRRLKRGEGGRCQVSKKIQRQDSFYSSFNKQQEFGCGQAWRPGGNCSARRAEDVESAKKLLRLFNQRGCRQCDGNDKNAQTILESKRLEWSERHVSHRLCSEWHSMIYPYASDFFFIWGYFHSLFLPFSPFDKMSPSFAISSFSGRWQIFIFQTPWLEKNVTKG